MLLYERDGTKVRTHLQFGLNAVSEDNLFWDLASVTAPAAGFDPDRAPEVLDPLRPCLRGGEPPPYAPTRGWGGFVRAVPGWGTRRGSYGIRLAIHDALEEGDMTRESFARLAGAAILMLGMGLMGCQTTQDAEQTTQPEGSEWREAPSEDSMRESHPGRASDGSAKRPIGSSPVSIS